MAAFSRDAATPQSETADYAEYAERNWAGGDCSPPARFAWSAVQVQECADRKIADKKINRALADIFLSSIFLSSLRFSKPARFLTFPERC
jgi:hypothetical protein